MSAASVPVNEIPLVLYALRRADDALILGHRLSEWCGHAPMMEEDMALANMGLDLIGQARELYSYAAKVEGADNDEDKLAYLRDVRQYRNLLLVEQPNGDFAQTIVRQFFYSAFADLRLGDGTDESHRRAQAAIEDLWAFTGELFHSDENDKALITENVAIDPESLREGWTQTVFHVLQTATLTSPASVWMQKGGRLGHHSEHLGHLLSELQSLQRTFPGATW
ncbi:MAG: phenylacetate-CoA oxygenase subunit PaaC [Afipia sp.]|nr:phenylacetate-CoA oxygenase subunit PaaC [Afipia sp.]